MVGKAWDVNFALVFWGGGQGRASVPKGQAELYQCRSSSASPAPAPTGTWSGAELCMNGGNGGTGNAFVALHAAFLSWAGKVGTKLWKRDVYSRQRRCHKEMSQEVRSMHGAVAHLQLPSGTCGLPGVRLPSAKGHHLSYCFKGCFH